MKQLVITALFLWSLNGMAQDSETTNINSIEKVKVENLDIVVTVDSAEEIKRTFKVEDIKEMFDLTGDNESVSFKLICNGETMSNGEQSQLSYKIKGNSNNVEDFIVRVKELRDAAIKYYNKKK
ncbi:MAG: hypothetical protein HRU50_12885 [Winogradskyella sp.]|uniref:hypothetical protein n=1 Tax=Winogradskyella sp. TaxID=1883156 RepID=UPI0025D2286F|nr:hypothetical protein [Winogradskyella sp.]NRB60819.1 hypothetical protein [Winogradskyella sp.]